MLDEVTLDVIVHEGRKRWASLINRYLALVRSILLRARDDYFGSGIDKAPKVKLFKGTSRAANARLPRAKQRRCCGELPMHQRDVVLFALAYGLRHANVARTRNGRTSTSTRVMRGSDAGAIEESQADCRTAQRDSIGRSCGARSGKHPQFACLPACEAAGRGPAHACVRRRRGGTRRHRGLPLARPEPSRWAIPGIAKSGTPTHELQRRLGGWRSSVMVERYAHRSARPSGQGR